MLQTPDATLAEILRRAACRHEAPVDAAEQAYRLGPAQAATTLRTWANYLAPRWPDIADRFDDTADYIDEMTTALAGTAARAGTTPLTRKDQGL